LFEIGDNLKESDCCEHGLVMQHFGQLIGQLKASPMENNVKQRHENYGHFANPSSTSSYNSHHYEKLEQTFHYAQLSKNRCMPATSNEFERANTRINCSHGQNNSHDISSRENGKVSKPLPIIRSGLAPDSGSIMARSLYVRGDTYDFHTWRMYNRITSARMTKTMPMERRMIRRLSSSAPDPFPVNIFGAECLEGQSQAGEVCESDWEIDFTGTQENYEFSDDEEHSLLCRTSSIKIADVDEGVFDFEME